MKEPMSTVGQIEKKTQQRVVRLFREQLGSDYIAELKKVLPPVLGSNRLWLRPKAWIGHFNHKTSGYQNKVCIAFPLFGKEVHIKVVRLYTPTPLSSLSLSLSLDNTLKRHVFHENGEKANNHSNLAYVLQLYFEVYQAETADLWLDGLILNATKKGRRDRCDEEGMDVVMGFDGDCGFFRGVERNLEHHRHGHLWRHDYNLIYEDDQGLVWLDYTRDYDNWGNQVNWAAGLNDAGVLTYNLNAG